VDLNGLGLGRTFTEEEARDIAEMSNAHNRELLYEIGEVASRQQVKPEHFG
jgi:hypothetical protein